ncbi:MAG TPA: hypothetical protein PKL61_08795 [Accumulibacter sp.]|uniref:hypothetical protein n=1 Tax=Accumulibacter sp. TaxID=2053492 RepID=UPI002BD06EAF|nr:hypothetical protein [Accumulibacter sp.]HNL97249.1 hypothetical protein [Accumulibacter sp.]
MLTCEIRARSALDAATTAQMYTLFERHYAATTSSRFAQDLAAKDWVLLLRDVGGTLRGFSTLQVYQREHAATRCRILFSGDTVIERDYWGEQELAFNWLRLAGRLHGEQPELRHFWFLISKGPRTFRYLPAFACRFYPSWSEARPPFEASLLDQLAREHFGENFDPHSGVVRFAASRGHLRQALAEISARELRLPAVRFFLARNPGYAQGDELCCLCELAPANLKPVGRRLFLKGVADAEREVPACSK